MKSYLESIIKKSLGQFGTLEEEPEIIIEQPRIPEHGDLSTNVAMTLTKVLRKNPRAIAQEIIDNIEYDPKKIKSIEIAGPGFINFRFAEQWLYDQLQSISSKESTFGRSDINKGKNVLVEFVSANPTGPLTVGHGRNAVLGDTVARLFEWTGADVEREYYFNDAGRQMRVLAQSVQARYLELVGVSDFEFPEDGYQGEYIRDIARTIVDEKGDSLKDAEDLDTFKEYAQELIFRDIQQTLERMNIRMNNFFNEHDLYVNGAIDDVVQKLRDKGLVYEKEDATWFKTTEFGKDKDTVLIKSTGEPTYRLPDIAYHRNKIQRGYDLCIDVFGADHIATYPDVVSAVNALGFDTDKIEVLVYQFVTLVKDGRPFKMSTRKANFVTLDELMDMVGSDVTRFFFLMRSPGTHLEFDIGQAREAGEKNPVFYLQYAHARIQSIMRKVGDEFAFTGEPDLNLLTHDTEIALIKTLLRLPEIVQLCAQRREPHHMITYLNGLASDFTQFYHHCHILGEPEDLAYARKTLADATAAVLRNGLEVLGINAPDRM
ncbi:MAG TPA: arginine--tRNA ligase [Balneolales bacterium]|nr:arginine--tRNA ligase [Balneolales bacterium]